jgi:hypothetical protein
MIRGHRYYALFIASTLLVGFLVQWIHAHQGKRARGLILALVLLVSGATLVHRLPLMLAFDPDARDSRMARVNKNAIDVMSRMAAFPVIARDEPAHALICNRGANLTDHNQYTTKVAWNAILYNTRFGCSSNIGSIKIGNACNCRAEQRKQRKQNNICIDRGRDRKMSIYQ